MFASTIYFGAEQRSTREVTWDFGRFNFFDRLRVWYSRGGPTEDDNPPDRDNLIVLSEAFWKEIEEHPIPVDLNVVRGLANNPGALDLYTWLSYRCHQSKRSEAIPLFGVTDLPYWPECPAHVAEKGGFLMLKPATAVLPAQSGTQRTLSSMWAAT